MFPDSEQNAGKSCLFVDIYLHSFKSIETSQYIQNSDKQSQLMVTSPMIYVLNTFPVEPCDVLCKMPGCEY